VHTRPGAAARRLWRRRFRRECGCAGRDNADHAHHANAANDARANDAGANDAGAYDPSADDTSADDANRARDVHDARRADGTLP